MVMIPAWGHGLGIDVTPVIKTDDAEFAITIEIPSYYEQTDKRQVVMTAVDRQTEQNVEDLVFDLAIYGRGAMIMEERLVAPDGVTIMEFEWNDSTIETGGNVDPVHDAFYGTLEEPVRVTGPVFGSGLYGFETTIRSVGGVAGPHETYRADVSIVETATFMKEDAHGEQVKFRTKSYFDGISEFSYTPAQSVRFEMPFDWSEREISHIPVVHEEVHFPKEFGEFFTASYTGQVNGIELFKSSITVDDYTEEKERIVHFVLTPDQVRHVKNQLRQAGQTPGDTMVFTLNTADQVKFPISAWTRDEKYRVDISWDPVEVVPGTPTKFVFTIRDGLTSEPLRNSAFDFVILQQGKEIHRESGNAQVGGYFADYTFGENQTGTTTIRFEDIRGSGAATEFVVVVVPEFGIVALAVLGTGIIIAVWLASQRMFVQYRHA